MIKSPLNYMGNKFRQLFQLLELFPNNINNFLDLFCGGCDVSVNVDAKNITAVDSNQHLIEILQSFQNNSLNDILSFIDSRIQEFNLSKLNQEGYATYQQLYNTTKEYNTPLDLFILSRYSFSNIIRFNKKGKMNASFGMNRNGYNDSQKNNLINFHPKLQSIQLLAKDFRQIDFSQFDFIYADPPYFNSGAVYNTKGYGGQTWTPTDDYDLLNRLQKVKSKFALSNLIRHKGEENEQLLTWANDNKYKIHLIGSNYDSCIYSTKIPEEPTIEVCITNY